MLRGPRARLVGRDPVNEKDGTNDGMTKKNIE